MTTTTAGPARVSTGTRSVLAVTCLALATVVAAVASLNVAIPSIARDTRASSTELSWMVDAYSLVFAALLLPAGALGDRYGRRRALIAGLVTKIAAAEAPPKIDSPASRMPLRPYLSPNAPAGSSRAAKTSA